MIELCAIEGCASPAKTKTQKGRLCSGHYMRWKRHGDPLAGGTPRGATTAFIEQALSYTGDECLVWPFCLDGFGYGTFHQNGRQHRAARVLCERAHGPAPSPDHQAAHDSGGSPCTTRACINPSHLRWATPTENAHDRVAAGTHLIGADTNRAKLTDAVVTEIFALQGKATQAEIAARYGISPSNVSRIHSGDTWSWLTKPMESTHA
jgi:hypothetical protein